MRIILYVEDEPALRRAIVGLLRQEGYDALGAASAEEGLQVVEQHGPDLILCDIALPGMSGHEFLRHLRDDPATQGIPFIFVTAFDNLENRIAGTLQASDEYLTKPLDFDLLLAAIKGRLQRAEALEHSRIQEVIFRLSRATEYRDPETGNHIKRLAHYARLMAEGLDLSKEDRQMIFIAAPMHDVGKVAIPDEILLKPGKLTPDEFEVMKRHTEIGEEILGGSPSRMMRRAAQIALFHHERYDGSGYPRAIGGEAIPLFARIVAVADVFDALTSKRPYKAAWTCEAALEYVADQRGRQFDPDCVDAFKGKFDAAMDIRASLRDD